MKLTNLVSEALRDMPYSVTVDKTNCDMIYIDPIDAKYEKPNDPNSNIINSKWIEITTYPEWISIVCWYSAFANSPTDRSHILHQKSLYAVDGLFVDQLLQTVKWLDYPLSDEDYATIDQNNKCDEIPRVTVHGQPGQQ